MLLPITPPLPRDTVADAQTAAKRARDAGLWGDGDVSAGDGDTIIYSGAGVGAEGYVVQ